MGGRHARFISFAYARGWLRAFRALRTVVSGDTKKSFGIRYYAGAEAPDSYGRPGRDGSFRLLLRDGRTHRAGVGAASAIDADIGIDAVLVVALFDRFNGAIGRTSAAANAIISDLVCHFEIPPHIYVCSYYTQTMSEKQEGISAAARRRAMGTAL